MKLQTFRLTILAASLAAALTACGGDSSDSSSSSSSASTATTLSGVAASGTAIANADITVCDATGSKKTTKTDAQGAYTLDISGMTAPLLVGVNNAPLTLINSVAQPANGTILYTALLPVLTTGKNTANVNQLTDKISSDVASTDLALKGSVQLFNACKPAGVKPDTITAKTADLRGLIIDLLKAKNVSSPDSFDPVTVSMKADHTGVDAVLDTIRHNRDGWGSGSDDQLRGSKLYDQNLQEISLANGKVDPALKDWASYKTRIFVIGDSTASNYGKDVAPRMGWGQTFDQLVKDTTQTKVVNLAQSGRSSRSFITEGWFKVLSDNLKAGDYVLVQWGHNDEKCDTTGSLDWVNRCTYPNSATGTPQIAKTSDKLPEGVTATDLSFQKSLEKYVALAKSKGASIVLITPVTRIVQDTSVTTHNEGKFPIAKSTHITTKGDFPGNYSQTVIDTGKTNSVPVVDLDAKSIAFMNTVGVGTGGVNATGGWRDYHNSSTDFTKYPFYKTLYAADGVTPLAWASQTPGNYLNADRTHFKESGAYKVGQMIVEGIKADTSGTLSGLVSLLR